MHSVPHIARDFETANKLVQAGLRVMDWHMQKNPKVVFIMENPMMVCWRCRLMQYYDALFQLANCVCLCDHACRAC